MSILNFPKPKILLKLYFPKQKNTFWVQILNDYVKICNLNWISLQQLCTCADFHRSSNLTVQANIFGSIAAAIGPFSGRVTANRCKKLTVRGKFVRSASCGRRNRRKTRSIPAVFDNPVPQRLVQAADEF